MGSLRYVVPNLLTSANMATGMAAVVVAAAGHYDLAVYLLVGSVVLDMMDGPAARLLGATSRFGQQMDSLSDCVSFCVAPALLVYWAELQELGFFGGAVAFLYLITGVLRLARFNVSEDAHGKSRRSTGCPTPIGAGYLLAVALMRDHLPEWASVAIVVWIAGMMISTIPLPNTRGKATIATILVGLGTYIVLVVHPSWTTIGIWNGWNVVIVLVAGWEARRAEASPQPTAHSPQPAERSEATGRTTPASPGS